jgi:hypothetical protein
MLKTIVTPLAISRMQFTPPRGYAYQCYSAQTRTFESRVTAAFQTSVGHRPTGSSKAQPSEYSKFNRSNTSRLKRHSGHHRTTHQGILSSRSRMGFLIPFERTNSRVRFRGGIPRGIPRAREGIFLAFDDLQVRRLWAVLRCKERATGTNR